MLWAAAPACGGGPLAVVATSTDLRALVEEVGGDHVRVEAPAPPLADPHAVEITQGQIAALRGASLPVRVGLDHETWLAGLVRTVGDARFAPRGQSVLDCSKRIDLLQADTARVKPERGDHVHGFGNTHYWLDPENVRPITVGILDAFVRLAPGDHSHFESRRAAFLKRLDAGLKRWTDAMGPYRGAKAAAPVPRLPRRDHRRRPLRAEDAAESGAGAPAPLARPAARDPRRGRRGPARTTREPAGAGAVGCARHPDLRHPGLP